MKTLYVIIPVYKTEAYLRRCVESVLAQTYPAVRAILVDDGSPDGCPALCDALAAAHPQAVRVIHQENGGLSQARNAGMRLAYQTAAPEDYLCFLDSDDFLHPDFGEKMVALCEGFHCGGAQCGYVKGDGEVFPPQGGAGEALAQTGEEALLGYRLRSAAAMKVFTRAALEGVWFPAGRWNEDEFTVYRAVYQSGRFAFTGEKLYYYFQRGGSIMDGVAKRLKGNPRRWDWLDAFQGRIRYFEGLGKPEQVLRTREKICSEMILRYSEQMRLPRSQRDEDCVSGRYLAVYRENYRLMRGRPGIPWKRRLMYLAFRMLPGLAVLAGRLSQLRK